MAENPEHEGTAGDEEEEVTVGDGDEGDLEVVQPTEQWQTLKPGDQCCSVHGFLFCHLNSIKL